MTQATLFDRINPEPCRADEVVAPAPTPNRRLSGAGTVKNPAPPALRDELARREDVKARVLARLLQGPAFNHELAAICLRYTGAMFYLRSRDGYTITKEHIGGGVWRYTLTGRTASAAAD